MYSGNISVAQNYVDSAPTTYDFLKPNGFRFIVKDIPQVVYTCQKVTLPSLDFSAAIHSNPRLDYAVPGEKLNYGDLRISFIVSEDMQNFKEIYNWMLGMADHTGGSKFQELYDARRYKATSGIDRINKYNVQFSDATLVVLNSNNNPITKIKFNSIFPISLSAMNFDSTVSSIQYITCDCVFKYTTFEIES
jgi:hypothetical protein